MGDGRNRQRFLGMAAAGLYVWLWLSCAASAQQPAVQDSRPEESSVRLVPLKTTVVVTATREEVDLVKAPASISVITSTDFERRNILLLDQALNLTEGMNVFRRDTTDGMGGVGMRGFAGRGSSQIRTLVLLDGQPINEGYEGSVNWAVIPVDEVDRVEVVRGPFSSLYGGSAMGGVVNVLTRPIDRTRADFSARYGSMDTVQYSGQLSKRFFERLGLGVAYNRLQVGGFASQETVVTGTNAVSGTPVTGAIPVLTPTGGQAYIVGIRGADWTNLHTWRTRAEYSWSSRSALYLQWIHHNNDRGSDGYETYLRNAAGTPVDEGSYLVIGWGLQRITVHPRQFLAGGGGLRARVYTVRFLRSLSSANSLQLSAGLLDTPSDFSTALGSTARAGSGSGTVADRRGRGWYGNGLFSSRLGGRHSVSVGAETRRDTSRSNEWLLPDWTVVSDRSQLTAITQGKSLTAGIYAQDQISVHDRLSVVLGGRYDYWRTWNGMTDRFTAPTPLEPYPARSCGSATGRAAAVWQAPGGLALRASIGAAFRSPSIFELYRASTVLNIQLVPNPDLKPESMTSWEFGARKSAGSGFLLEGTYYENRVRDLIYRTRDLAADPGGRIRPLTNAGQSRIRGVEAVIGARLFRWLSWRSNYTLQDAVITENPSLPDTVGKRVPFVPKNMTATTLTASASRWTAFLAGRYSGGMFAADINNDTTRGVPQSYDPFFLLEASLGCRFNQHLQLQVIGENLLDRSYYIFKRMPGRSGYVSLRITL